MESIIQKGSIFDWDPHSRLVVLRYLGPTEAMGAETRRQKEALEIWIGNRGQPFWTLVDLTKLASTSAEQRSIWYGFFRRHPESCSAAIGCNALVRVTAEMFRLATGVRLKVFENEEAARTWLRKNGLNA